MNLNFPKIEEKILKFWKGNRTFEKSISRRKKAENFVFYEGPPTLNGEPHIGHSEAIVFKDMVCRYKTMRGFRVLRKAGWDTHGLPVELEIEKKLGLKSKKDIEKYGIAKFNKKCKESVWAYQKDWKKLTERIGFWLDLENPYITYTSDYIETVWWIIKQIYQKGLLYQDYKVVPYCCRCGTSLSSHEVALGYKRIKEPAIYIKFPISNSQFPKANLLVWTTTPWTLPGNVAVAVNPKFIYVMVKVSDEYLILAKERISACGIKGKILQEFKGKELLELKYEPLFTTRPGRVEKKSYFVISGDFVSLEEGTGLVHIAPAFGEVDMEAVKEQIPNSKFQIPKPVDERGKMITPGYKWDKMFVKEADPLIIEDLRKRDLLFKEEKYEHDYPFCWRCDSPLLYYAKQSWFINMQKVKKDLIKNNQKINWIPSHLKQGRFGEWLREIKDWAFSRERYWGTPIPVWKCKSCKNLEVIGSKKDLINQKFTTNKYFILRHGETIYQVEKRELTYPWPEKKPILLTEKGQAKIKKIAKKLRKEKIDLIFSSDMPRTGQTAEIVAKELGIKIIFDERLRDVNLGVYHGRTKKEFFRDFPKNLGRFNRKPPQGESWSDCKKRMIECLNEIDKKYNHKNILIISHGDPLWLLEGIMEGLDERRLLERKIKGKYIKVGELRKIDFKRIPLNQNGELDFHRPYIDEVKFYCPKCQNLMERVPEVLDCWFDSGSMPFAQYHYPFENPEGKPAASYGASKKLKPPELFPADYISEAVDQTRGWFYTLLAISTLLGFGTPYKNVISLGHVLDKKGEKMSKSKGNVVDPWKVVEKYGADATRWYFFTVNQPGDVKLFSEKEVEECLKRFILTLWNSYQFLETYGQHFSPSGKLLTKKGYILDRWIISKLNQLILKITENLDKYDVTGAARAIENFVIDDLSQWYIRRSRKRFHQPELKKDFKEAFQTLNFTLFTLSKLTAPFIPFLSEEIYHRCLTPGVKHFRVSVHLEDWPKFDKKLIDEKLNKKMERIREVVSLALAERAKAGIKVRQPLGELQITNYELKREKELLELIKDEVNIKEISFGKTLKLDTKITPGLKEEGMIREVIRQIQEMRKRAKLKPKDKILVQYFGEPKLNEILEKNKKIILKETKAKDFLLKEKTEEIFIFEKETKVDQEKLYLAIKKIK